MNETFTEHAAEIVAAYVAHNSLPVAELPNLLRSVHDTLATLGLTTRAEPRVEPLRPAVPIRRSVTDEYIISLEDGRKFKTLKRHLASLGMTPDDYRTKWGLRSDYPMVAPVYAVRRSELAKAIGLGAQRSQVAPGVVPTSRRNSEPPV